MIVNLNMKVTIARQNNKCLKCKVELPTDKNEQVFFIMDQTKDIYEVYCTMCGDELKK